MAKTENILRSLAVILLTLGAAFLLWKFSPSISSFGKDIAISVGLIEEQIPEIPQPLVYYDTVVPVGKKVDATALKCMADNIYYEASNQSSIGKMAVGRVVINRVRDKRFPSSVCGVIYQKANETCQFSWTCQEEEYRTPINKAQYRESKEIAYKLLAFDMYADSFKNIKFYHNATVNPGWANKSKVVVKLEDHTFYSEIR